ncbi:MULTISPECIES: hypothetical protein [unclassified Streptomyces]|uniref:hypothetical protein n=2 Tax=unclassified Streptomyces TaxID=2593676 RepID=UPI0013D9199E|nr:MULTISPECIES: hypothetical protein [unclassified Streptomyces]
MRAEEQAWAHFAAKSDKGGFLTSLGVATIDALPSRWPDGSDFTESALDVCTGVTRMAKQAVGLYGEGKLSDEEIKKVLMAALRILTGLSTWNQPLCYTQFSIQWTKEAIELLRSKSLDSIADAYQAGLDLIVRCHETMGHKLIK